MSDTLDLSQPGHDLRLMNPPAFGHGDHQHGGEPGMSLRDYFAGQALQGWLASSPGDSGWFSEGTTRATRFRGIAEEAYKISDAMLAARQKERADD